MDNNKSPIIIDNNFQLEINYAYIDQNNKSKTEYFLIDIVDVNKLDEYVKVIDEDVKRIRMVL